MGPSSQQRGEPKFKFKFKQRFKKRISGLSDVTSESVLEKNAQMACRLLSAISDALNIPIMKGIVSCASEVIAIAQTVQSNKVDCVSLAKQLEEYMSLLEGCSDCSEKDLDEQSRAVFQTVHDTLQQLKALMIGHASRGVVRRTFTRVSDKKRITAAKEDLNQALQKFVIAVHNVQLRSQRRIELQLCTLSRKVDFVQAQNVCSSECQEYQILKMNQLDVHVRRGMNELIGLSTRNMIQIRIQSAVLFA